MSNIPNYAGLFPKLRLMVDNELDKTLTNREWEYFIEEFNERVDAMTETICQDLIETSDEWLDDDNGAGE